MSELAALHARLRELEAELSKCRERLDAIQSDDVDTIMVRARGAYTFDTADHPYRVLIDQITSPVITSMRRSRTCSGSSKAERRHKPVSSLFNPEEWLYAGHAKKWAQATAFNQEVALYTRELRYKIHASISLEFSLAGLNAVSRSSRSAPTSVHRILFIMQSPVHRFYCEECFICRYFLKTSLMKAQP